MTDAPMPSSEDLAAEARDLSAAWDNLQRLSQFFKGVIDVAPRLRDLASMFNAEVESRARLDKIREDIRAAEDERARQSRLTIADAESKASKILTAANNDADKVRNAARAEAATLLAPVQDQLAKLKGDTEAAQTEHAKASTALGAKQSELAAISAEVQKLTSLHGHFQDHETLVAEIAQKEERLATLNTAIEKLRAQFGG